MTCSMIAWLRWVASAVETQPASAAKRYVTNGLAEEPTPDAVAAASDRIAVFRIEEVRALQQLVKTYG
jgi:hypothetical protein